MKKSIRILDVLLAIICTIAFIFIILGNYYLPNQLVSYNDSDCNLSLLYSFSNNKKAQSVDYQSSYPRQETVKLLGVVPVKTVSVTNKNSPTVFVSGEVFGIKLYTDGVIVVGTQDVDIDNKTVNPTKEAGIQVGDVIVSINNVNVYTADDVTNILNNNNGMAYKIRLKRDGRYKTFILNPVYSNKEGCYKAGMWVRDSTAGIGTITFYNNEAGTFAALGHQINDVDTNKIMPMLEGEAVSTTITDVQKGNSGSTGSLVCDFNDFVIGKLLDNSPYGVYGAFTGIPDIAKPYQIASIQEIKKGEAKILSTVTDGNPELYDIEITHIGYSATGERDIVFKVTDDKLIQKTGGIVQGMSGSPIIQNGKLIGAVTHVIINNPKKGYGIFAQTMLEKSNNVP